MSPFSILLTLFWFYSAIIPASLLSQNQECYLLMVGKEASVDGNVYLAHNNDLSGTEAAMLVRVSAEEVIEELPGFSWPPGSGYDMLVLQIYKGFDEGDAVAINEYGVAIAGGLALGKDRNRKAELADPLVESGLGGGARYIALKHARTARQCVELIGRLYTQFGVKYPSGFGVADSNEIWYVEAGGGHSWAAVKVPDSCYFIAANSYRIGEINVEDSLNCMASPGLKEFCIQNQLWNESYVKFNFTSIFGGGRKEKFGNNLYNTRRIWRGTDHLNPDLMLPPDTEFFPMFLKPSRKIDLQGCFSILRDHYEGTPFDPLLSENDKNPERAIACWNCVHTDVITLMPGEPVAYGAVIWTGLSTPFSAIYVPVYYGVSSIPTGYNIAASTFNPKSAFWKYKIMSDKIRSGEVSSTGEWFIHRNQFEKEEIDHQSSILTKARKLQKETPNQVGNFLGSVSESFAATAFKLIQKTGK